jgi:hypothetical protein
MSEQVASVTNAAQPDPADAAGGLLRSLRLDLERVWDRFSSAPGVVRERYGDRDPVFLTYLATEIDGVVRRAREVADLLAAVAVAWESPPRRRVLPTGKSEETTPAVSPAPR